MSRFVVFTRNDTWSSVARHVPLGRSPRLCSRWKVSISRARQCFLKEKQNNACVQDKNVRDILRTLRENLNGKHAGPFEGVVTVAYLKVCENIHRCVYRRKYFMEWNLHWKKCYSLYFKLFLWSKWAETEKIHVKNSWGWSALWKPRIICCDEKIERGMFSNNFYR